jgi:hypothetical protein
MLYEFCRSMIFFLFFEVYQITGQTDWTGLSFVD